MLRKFRYECICDRDFQAYRVIDEVMELLIPNKQRLIINLIWALKFVTI